MSAPKPKTRALLLPILIATFVSFTGAALIQVGITIGKHLASSSAHSTYHPINPTEDELASSTTDSCPSGDCVLGTTNIAINNSLPSSGYHRRQIKIPSGSVYTIDIVAADLNSTQIIVDTASTSDCTDNCPVLSLRDYINRNGAYAGINGSYFCPATYPSCAGKKNSFDTLLMNKSKTYFNSANNVYSTVPAVIFQGNSARFVAQSLEWGRDTGPDAVIANYPLLVFNNQIHFNGSPDGKLNGKGSRSFIGAKDNMVYIGVIRNASTADAAKVLHAMGMQNALNLDSGGSTALYHGGYKAGPGRGIPNAILFKVK